MRSKLKKLLEAVKVFQGNKEELKSIEKQKDKLLLESKYRIKFNEIINDLFNEGIVITFDAIEDKSYDEILEYVIKVVKDKINVALDYDENDLVEYFNELSEDDKKNYGSYEEFKKKILEDYEKEQETRKTRINSLVEELKNIKGLSEDLNLSLQKLNDQRTVLLGERWSMLQKELKNCHVSLLEKGIEYQNGLPVIKDDMELVNKVPKLDENSFSIDDLVMVHATKYFPQNGVVKTSRDAIGSKRNTIHTSLNGRVSSHNFGNWEDCSIIVLDPLREHIDQVECIYSVDTFTYGSMKLSDKALILIDVNKYEEFYQNNKAYIETNKDKIVLYSGNSQIVVEKMLSVLGYAPEKINQWSWDNKKDDDMLNNWVHNNYPNKLNVAHDFTSYSEVEKGSIRRDTLATYGIKDDGNDIIITPDVLYSLRKNSNGMTTEQFIGNVGVFVNDNEIHLLGIKDHIELLRNNQISPFQIEKIDLLIKKYELMLQKQNEEERENHR